MKRRKSEALCTAPKIVLLGAGCACLHGDGEHSPLGATGVLWWWERTYSNAHTHTHKDLIFATAASWEHTLWSCGCGNKDVFDIFIRRPSNVIDNKSESHESLLFLAHLIQYQLFSRVASQTRWVYRGKKKNWNSNSESFCMKRRLYFRVQNSVHSIWFSVLVLNQQEKEKEICKSSDMLLTFNTVHAMQSNQINSSMAK